MAELNVKDMTDAELEAIANHGEAPSMGHLTDDDLQAIVDGKPTSKPLIPPKAPPTAGEMAALVGNTVLKPFSKMVQTYGDAANTILEPINKVTGAPPRAFVGALERGEGFGGAKDAFDAQLKAGAPEWAGGQSTILPSTPTGEDIALKGIKSAGIAAPFAEKMAPMGGLIADAGLDLLNFVPNTAVEKVAAGGAKLAAKAEMATVRAIANVGTRVTNGALDAEKALRMYKELTVGEMMMPGTKNYGALKAQMAVLGGMRDAFATTPISLPGTHEVAQQIIDMAEAVKARGFRTPGSKNLINSLQSNMFTTELVQEPAHTVMVMGPIGQPVEEMVPATVRKVQTPRDLTLDEMDDAIRIMDDITYSMKGNPKTLGPVWEPAVKRARAIADESLQTVPEGQLFKQEKTRAEALHTAGRERGALIEAGANAAPLLAVATKNPLVLVMRALVPGTFVNMLAMAKIPREVMETMTLAHSTGSLRTIRDAVDAMAAKFPEATERVMRAAVLVSQKPDGRKFLTADESDNLGAPRSFDPADITAERQRLDADKTMSSVEKARKLSNMNERGYVVLDRPRMIPGTPTEKTLFGGRKGLNDLLKSLENTNGAPAPRQRLGE